MSRPCIAPTPSLTGYKYHRCRCDGCREASRVYNATRSRQVAYNRWEGLVDAEPVRQHVRALQKAGVGWQAVAQRAGAGVGCVSRLLYGSGGSPPSRRVRAETARKLLAVTASPSNLKGGAYVDATGTRRRTQALVAIGWSVSEQARLLGRTYHGHAPLLKKRMVTARTARAVAGLYERLSMTPAPYGTAALRARTWAAKRGWVAPLAWDDDSIDDPQAVPATGGVESAVDPVAVERALAGGRVVLTDAEQVEAIRLGVATGEPLTRVAARLGINYFGARQMLDGVLTPRRELQARVEAALARMGASHPDTAIGALLGVHHQTVTRARARLAKKQDQLAS